MSLVLNCEQCNKEYKVCPYLKDKSRFCSKKCLNDNKIGKKLTKEHIKKLRGRKPWNKGLKGLPIWNKGLKGLHLSPKSEFKKGIKPWNTGTKGVCKPNKGSFKKGDFIGNKNPNWEGGISKSKYAPDWNKTLRIAIRERDNYVCQICGDKQDDRAFSVHHIDYDKLNCNSDNLITLCVKCHAKTNKNRDYWKEFFKQKILCR